jgi:hypoxanthine phosphoribosyltransferase
MIRYDWTDVEADVRILYDAIKKRLNENNQKIGTIIGIQRGGLIPAVMLSHLFRVEMKSLRWQTRDQSQSIDDDTLTRVLLNCKMDEIVLVVDEIADSGKTLNDIHKQIASFNDRVTYPVIVYYAVIVQRTTCRLDMPIISANLLDSDEWVHFPWESD